MNIAILGSGGREHSICDKLKQSKSNNKLFCLPGNAGTSKIATNINCNILDFHGFLFAYVFHYVILACCSLVFYFFYAMQTYYYPQPYIKV